ncbi:hypothetical protein BV898_14253 [Hypsibius exemplaris]|uniref:Uncharacterized protein n=1 Tax=Hypsibius exemplaris TaxID=2072580 RepID=A0A1W0W8C6_HYPEX|nr:hypothetical protein BV898_14253 [Hypsibius exemplaris]
MNSNGMLQTTVVLLLATLATLALQVVARPGAASLDYGSQLDQMDSYPSLYSAKYLRRNGPAYWSPAASSSSASDQALTVGVPVVEPSPASFAAVLDSYNILPPVKRQDVRPRSILCYFNSVSCFGRKRDA